MDATAGIHQTVLYIEEHLHEKLDISTLAGQAALSPFYFHRLFARYTGMTVMEYVKSRRLTRAARAIRSSEDRLYTIAGEVGYDNYESFSRDFKRQYGIAPNVYRLSPDQAVVLTPVLDVKLQKRQLGVGEMYVSDGMTLQIDIISYDKELYAVGISKLAGLTRGKDDPGMLWGCFTDEIKKGIVHQVQPPVEYGIGLSNYESHGFTYITARAVTTLDDVPDGYTGFAIPAGTYAVCTFEAESFELLTNEVLYKAGKYMLATWLPGNREYAFRGGMTVEVYDTDSFAADVPRMRYLFPVERRTEPSCRDALAPFSISC